ncbi:hypothetical protein [Paenibacillus montanisoli]|uniref:Uncharacterized protein n=1 Tax=Paenibacillus montanisoli TaxID=2081970 RepID=A0A328TX18_9BACL|nr:hypothetical protein [Paenibacillus montanisoli]RAP75018.1 hypothetical protein DL346_16625 [Paenibacillus montanisoli]
MKRYVFLIVTGGILVLLAVLAYWDVYRPKVGPVGNAPDDAAVMRELIYRLLSGLSVMFSGILGVYGYSKKKK